ncbi:MAG: RluA family pseudouridine synthase, partial [Polyangiaceae bacterium]
SEADGKTLGDVVARAGADARAIAEGRVFIGKIRATRADEKVSVGDRIEISSNTKAHDDVTILFRGEGIVVIDKPSGISTIPDQAGSSETAIALAARATDGKVSDLHPTSRLDREVSGVVIFARTKQAADALLEARSRGGYVRRYVAIVADTNLESGIWDAAIGRARDPKLRAAFSADEKRHEAKASRTAFRVVARAGKFALMAFAPETGRTHQIRVHASHSGAPLLGDRAYGGATRLALPSGKIMQATRIYLHCARVSIEKSGKFRDFSAPIPVELSSMWAALGGDAAAWDTALACDISSSSL